MGNAVDNTTFILFSRAPIPGQTKTRLAAAVGDQQAVQFHLLCLQDTLAVCAEAAERITTDPSSELQPSPVCMLYITPPESRPVFEAAGIGQGLLFRPQEGKSLGERMAQAFRECLPDTGPASGALLLGTDLPLLQARHLTEAAALLQGHDVVLGPAVDGGYYLIGLKQPHVGLFDLEGWGGTSVLDQTITRATALGLSTALLEPLPDVDTLADLQRIRAHPSFPQLSQRKSIRWIAERQDAANLATPAKIKGAKP